MVIPTELEIQKKEMERKKNVSHSSKSEIHLPNLSKGKNQNTA